VLNVTHEKNEIVIVGAGLLGSIFTDTLMSHLHSIPTSLSIAVIDHDKLEHRNCVGNHTVIDYVGMPKAKLVVRRFQQNGFSARYIVQRLTEKNAGNLLSRAAVLVGAVDNVSARVNMWNAATELGIPYLDMGVNMNNFVVSWTYRDLDNMPFSPNVTAEAAEIKEVKKPPCELIGTRIQAGVAAELAAKSLMIFLSGADPSGVVGSFIGEGAEHGDLVSWNGIMAGAQISVMGSYLGRRASDVETTNSG